MATVSADAASTAAAATATPEAMQRKSSLKSGDPDLRRSRKLKGLLLTKYDSVCEAAAALGWAVIHPDEEEAGPSEPHPSVAPRGSAPPPPQFTSDWNICWMDTSVSIERVMALGRLQKLNHFPGMLDLVRKAGTARNLNKMLKVVGKEYKFFPRTFMLPADYTELKKEFGGARRCNKTFIVKPSKGCQGTGIMLTRCLDDIDPHEPNIVQRYLHKPHLLDGRKYDLRLYVLQSSIKPLRLYLFREGLVRVCTSKYACKPSNYNELTMHLTNYAINKESDDFVQPSGVEDDEANKLTVTTLMARLAAEGADVDALWEAIGELVVKTMVSVQPHLEHTYYTARQRSDDVGYSCFELLGFDVLFDHKLRPYLLEVNHSPSFTCDSPLDSLVKASVLKGTMEMVSFGRDELKILKRCGTRLDPPTRERLCQLRNAYENARAEPSGFERIYPPSGPSAERAAELLARYDSYLDLAAELYQSQSLAGSRRTGGTQISGGGTHRRVAVPSWGPPPPAPVAAPAAAAARRAGVDASVDGRRSREARRFDRAALLLRRRRRRPAGVAAPAGGGREGLRGAGGGGAVQVCRRAAQPRAGAGGGAAPTYTCPLPSRRRRRRRRHLSSSSRSSTCRGCRSATARRRTRRRPHTPPIAPPAGAHRCPPAAEAPRCRCSCQRLGATTSLDASTAAEPPRPPPSASARVTRSTTWR